MGYVDSMGRFVTEIERDPHRKYGKFINLFKLSTFESIILIFLTYLLLNKILFLESRLSRAVKRLIHMEEDKVNLFIII